MMDRNENDALKRIIRNCTLPRHLTSNSNSSIDNYVRDQNRGQSDNVDNRRRLTFVETTANTATETELRPENIQFESNGRGRFHQRVWNFVKRVYTNITHFQMNNQIVIQENVIQNSVSNLLKMIILPILLITIAIFLMPLFKEIANQTFYAVFFNEKLPENRVAVLKRISIGVTLIFEHMVKKIFPLIQLRWDNSKLFKRRRASVTPIVSQQQ
ncbi:hypothetical protein PGB90_000021 [Kerria lacca]